MKLRLAAGLALLSYGLVVFADEGLSELIKGGTEYKGDAVYPSPLILGSQWGFRLHSLESSGTAAVLGFLTALLGVYFLRFRPRPDDYDSSEYIRAALETLICGSLWVAAWCSLILVFQPTAFSAHATQFLEGTGITNEILMIISLAGFAVFLLARVKLRYLLEM